MTLHYAYLCLENEEVGEICSSVEGDMRAYLDENYPEHYQTFFGSQMKDPTIPDLEENIESSPQTLKNKDLKKLYRKIATKTHPDKSSNKTSSQLFAQAAKAYSKNDMGKLLEIAGNINIEMPALSSETISLLKENIKTLCDKIERKKQTSAWLWHTAKTNEEKRDIIRYILNTKGVSL